MIRGFFISVFKVARSFLQDFITNFLRIRMEIKRIILS